MKVKVLSRNPDDYIRETKKDIQRGKYFLYFDQCCWCAVFLYCFAFVQLH